NDVHPDDTVNGGVGCGVARETAPDVPGDPGDQHDPPHGREVLLAELATLHARLLEELAVLLLRHTLAALLDHRSHGDHLSLTTSRASRSTRRALTSLTGCAPPAEMGSTGGVAAPH